MLRMNHFKRIRLLDHSQPASTLLIATHSGSFQADEALGVWLLRQTVTYRSSPIVRTRDPQVYSKAAIVIDVGGVYDHNLKRYDHHQHDYNERFSPKQIKQGSKPGEIYEEERCTKLSASGLIYRHYGRDVIQSFYPDLSNEYLELAYVSLYDKFMEAIDAVDTGVEPFQLQSMDGDMDRLSTVNGKLLYRDETVLSKRIARMNRRWNEPFLSEDMTEEQDADERFEKASAVAGQEFLEMLISIVESDIPAKIFVEEAVRNRFSVDSSGEIIKLDSGGLPWRQYLYEFEKEMGLSSDAIVDNTIKFVLYPDQTAMWRVQAVTTEGKSFENRISLPEVWRGIRDEALSSLAGIPGCTFCHSSGFIGGNSTYEGSLAMARAALKHHRTIASS